MPARAARDAGEGEGVCVGAGEGEGADGDEGADGGADGDEGVGEGTDGDAEVDGGADGCALDGAAGLLAVLMSSPWRETPATRTPGQRLFFGAAGPSGDAPHQYTRCSRLTTSSAPASVAHCSLLPVTTVHVLPVAPGAQAVMRGVLKISPVHIRCDALPF
jgi:hypothetical protein